MNKAVQGFLGSLGDNGGRVLVGMNLLPGLSQDIAAFAIERMNEIQRISTGLKSNQAYTNAREIMGKNFLGVEEAVRCFGVRPTENQLSALADIPWDEKTLQDCAETHVLVAIFPISIMDIRRIVMRRWPDEKLFPVVKDGYQEWYLEFPFANDLGKVGWMLIRKTILPDSSTRWWWECKKILKPRETMLTAQQAVYAIVEMLLTTSEKLFEGKHTWCSDNIENEPALTHAPIVGFGDDGEVDIDHKAISDKSYTNVGVVPAIKPQKNVEK